MKRNKMKANGWLCLKQNIPFNWPFFFLNYGFLNFDSLFESWQKKTEAVLSSALLYTQKAVEIWSQEPHVFVLLCCRHRLRLGFQRVLLGALRNPWRRNQRATPPQPPHVSHPLRPERQRPWDPPPGAFCVTRRCDVRERLCHHGLETILSWHHELDQYFIRCGCWI